jgi:hypothetical protein
MLRYSGNRADGGGRIGVENVILIDRLADAERAIALLSKIGIEAILG